MFLLLYKKLLFVNNIKLHHSFLNIHSRSIEIMNDFKVVPLNQVKDYSYIGATPLPCPPINTLNSS